MYIVMKEGLYFTGEVQHNEKLDLRWTRHRSKAKIWKQKRAWAQLAANKWGGEVIEINKNAEYKLETI